VSAGQQQLKFAGIVCGAKARFGDGVSGSVTDVNHNFAGGF
jgi:hypothetical protein